MDTRTNIPVDELQSIVGADNVREATEDAVDGVEPPSSSRRAPSRRRAS